MAQITSPKSFRIGVNKGWDSRWLNLKNTPQLLKEDHLIRKYLSQFEKEWRIEKIEIERKADHLKIILFVGRPGLVIGHQGQGIEKLQKQLTKLLKNRYKINLVIEEVKSPDISAQIIAESAAEDIEKRVLYRQVMKRYISRVRQHKEAQGVKIMLSGRLDGNEIARDEWLRDGRLPLSTLRADIDYGFSEAHCTYGVVGVKVWIYKQGKADEKITKK